MTEISVPLSQGFLASAGLIIAIGTQNAFVLSQGLTRKFNLLIATICCTTDALLITAGVLGMGLLISENPGLLLIAALGGGLFLTIYSLKALHSAFYSGALDASERALPDVKAAILTTYAITLLNPHVYLDTIILIGSIAQQFSGDLRVAFAIGASLSSFVFFFSLSYGAKLLAPIMQNPNSWRILDGVIAIIMFSIAFKLAVEGNWL